MRDATNVLLEGTPAHINLAAVEDAILETKESRMCTTCMFGRSLPAAKL
jgi:Co/Zn/Cd efflux system component